MSEPIKDLVVPGCGDSITVPSMSSVCVPIKNKMPGITILVHGVNDVGEAFPSQEEGICAGLNERLRRSDIQPAKYEMPPKAKDGDKFTAAEVHPDPDKVYYQRKPELGTSPVIPFYWGFREETELANIKGRHGQYLDRFGNRLDKRYAKNGGPFANATSNVPDMFGKGFNRDFWIWLADPKEPGHALLSAPQRNYMVLGAQRLAALIRIIRKRSEHEPINIVAHSQGGFITLLAHAILASEKTGLKADTIILNNTPYSLEETFMEKFQAGFKDQQTASARESTLCNITKYITSNPAAVPAFSELKEKGGVVGKTWAPDANKERDNRGKLYLYFSPDDTTVGLPNIQGIGWWGVYDGMLAKLGDRFLQRMFASPAENASNPGAPPVGSSPYKLTLKFKLNAGFTLPRPRTINGEALPAEFEPELGKDELPNGPIDAAIASANPYNKKGKEGIRSDETPAMAQARWLNATDRNSYHSSIVSNPMHSQKSAAYDLCIGVSDILKNNDLNWMHFLRAVADWRTNWAPSNLAQGGDASFSPVSDEVMGILQKISDADKKIILGNHEYFALGKPAAGKLPSFTAACTLDSLKDYVISENMAARNTYEEQKKIEGEQRH